MRSLFSIFFSTYLYLYAYLFHFRFVICIVASTSYLISNYNVGVILKKLICLVVSFWNKLNGQHRDAIVLKSIFHFCCLKRFHLLMVIHFINRVPIALKCTIVVFNCTCIFSTVKIIY